tara:strand:+ start:200 stop:1513 length:1314 start_codon:yes stop_codon:yes gene_type:complete
MKKLSIKRWLQLSGLQLERLDLSKTASSGKTYAEQLGNTDNKGYTWEQSVEQALSGYLESHPNAWYSQNVRAREAGDFTYDVGMTLGDYKTGSQSNAKATKLFGTLECKFGKAQLGKIHKAFFTTQEGGSGYLKFTPNAAYTGGSFDYALNLEYCKKSNWDPQVLKKLITPILADTEVQKKMAQIIKSVLDSPKWPAGIAKPTGAFDISKGPATAFSRPNAKITAEQMKLIHENPPSGTPSTGDKSHWSGTINVASIGGAFIEFLGTTKDVILIGEEDENECIGKAWALNQDAVARTGLPLFTAPGGKVKVMPRFKQGISLVVETGAMESSTPGREFTNGEELFNLIKGLDKTKALDTFDTVSDLGAEYEIDTSPDSDFWNTDDPMAGYKEFVKKWNADPKNADNQMTVPKDATLNKDGIVENRKRRYSIVSKLLGK